MRHLNLAGATTSESGYDMDCSRHIVAALALDANSPAATGALLRDLQRHTSRLLSAASARSALTRRDGGFGLGADVAAASSGFDLWCGEYQRTAQLMIAAGKR